MHGVTVADLLGCRLAGMAAADLLESRFARKPSRLKVTCPALLLRVLASTFCKNAIICRDSEYFGCPLKRPRENKLLICENGGVILPGWAIDTENLQNLRKLWQNRFSKMHASISNVPNPIAHVQRGVSCCIVDTIPGARRYGVLSDIRCSLISGINRYRMLSDNESISPVFGSRFFILRLC